MSTTPINTIYDMDIKKDNYIKGLPINYITIEISSQVQTKASSAFLISCEESSPSANMKIITPLLLF